MIIIVMGVAGAGKTTIGRALAARLGWRFADGDEFHSAEHIEQLRCGIPLTDEDRQPWIAKIRTALETWLGRKDSVVLAASLLKAAYRNTVMAGYHQQVRLVYLKASPDVLHKRLAQRTGHFMGEAMLASQLAILDEPSDALMVDAVLPPMTIIERIRSALSL
jgi:gluconokinase